MAHFNQLIYTSEKEHDFSSVWLIIRACKIVFPNTENKLRTHHQEQNVRKTNIS